MIDLGYNSILYTIILSMKTKSSELRQGLFPQNFDWRWCSSPVLFLQFLIFGLREPVQYDITNNEATKIFLMAYRWTSYPNISYWWPMLSGLLIGFSIQLLTVCVYFLAKIDNFDRLDSWVYSVISLMLISLWQPRRWPAVQSFEVYLVHPFQFD